MTDSSTAAGWLRKSNFKEDNENDIQICLKRETAREFAVTTLRKDLKLYSQWFTGMENAFADSLSRDFHIQPHKLTAILKNTIPSQVPPTFRIDPLPQRISSWLGALLHQLPEGTQGNEKHHGSKLLHGKSGGHSFTPSKSTTMTSSTHSSNPNGPSSYPASPRQQETPFCLQALNAPWLRAQSEVPSTTWRRPLGTLGGRIQGSTETGKLAEFYANNLKAINEKTLPKTNRKPPPRPSSPKSPATKVPRELERLVVWSSSPTSSRSDRANTRKFRLSTTDARRC